jgi:GAF domain-containing protein
LVTAAHYGDQKVIALGQRRPIIRGLVLGRALLEARPIQVEDITHTDEFPEGRAIAVRMGHRTVMAVPLLRDGMAIGGIIMRRSEVKRFSDKQITLLQSFADQAVIAIENVRLFTELQEKNGAITAAHAQVAEALEQQTATAEILRVISSSPTDVQPIFDAIVRSASRLCGGEWAIVTRYDGELLHLAAQDNPRSGGADAASRYFPQVPRRGTSIVARALLDGAVVHVSDVETEDLDVSAGEQYRRIGVRAVVAVPMVHDGRPIGVVGVSRGTPGLFSDRQVDLLRTFADQAVIAIENVRLFTELQASNRDLTTALDKQIATADILAVISRSQTDVQPVFDAIVQSAVRLLRAHSGMVTRIAGDQLELAAFTSIGEVYDTAMRTYWPRPLNSKGTHTLAIRDRAPVNIADAASDPRVPEDGRAVVALRGIRSVVSVPLLRHDEAIGNLAVNRLEAGGFTDDEIALLKTFADQAVIAIENVRLFTETNEALERQTATAEILGVISSSPTNVKPVLETIVRSAVRLCAGFYSLMFLSDGGRLHLAATNNVPAEGIQALERRYPLALTSEEAKERLTVRAMSERRVLQVLDMQSEDNPLSESRRTAAAIGHRAVIAVPLMRQSEPIGVLSVSRREPRCFADKEVALLRAFADQAVIAIENVRLFKDLEARNRELTASLDRQTATGEILQAISQAYTDPQPVFDVIAAHAVRLCAGFFSAVYISDGTHVHVRATYNLPPEWREAARGTYPAPLASETVGPARVIREQRVIQILDVQEGSETTPAARERARISGYRTWIGIPMVSTSGAVGTIAVARRERRVFSDAEVALLKTFADQAVIAIENARLFNELQARTTELTRSVDELTALGEVGRALSSTLNLEAVLQTIATRATQLTETAGCVIWEYDKFSEEFRLRVSHYRDDTDAAILPARGGVTTIPRGQGLTTQAMQERQAVQIPDITVEGAYESPVRTPLIDAGHRALLGVPLLSEDEVVGVLAVTRKTPGLFTPETVRLLSSFATQSALAIQNARLFMEIEDKSRQLEAASQHKSEFLANMSHELRTPLNAIIGFSEVLTERMFGELNEKQEEYLGDIHASGQHLLSLINDILDLSKVEAGRMELELTDFHLPTALDNALTLVRERAGRRGIALQMTTAEGLEYVRADERKIKQVLLNLLSNAIKFTPEGGRIEVRARQVDGSVEIAVTDTGVGIAPEDQEAIFEEFRQVGTADKKVEGTGLGLALSRKFIELHRGRIWVESQVSEGSTFTFTIPIRCDA